MWQALPRGVAFASQAPSTCLARPTQAALAVRWHLVLLLVVVSSWGLLLNTLLMDSRQGSSSFWRMDRTLLQLMVLALGGIEYSGLDSLLQQQGGLRPAPWCMPESSEPSATPFARLLLLQAQKSVPGQGVPRLHSQTPLACAPSPQARRRRASHCCY